MTQQKLYVITDFFSQKEKRKNNVDPKYLTTEEVAEKLRQKPRTIANWAQIYEDSGGKEGIPGIKFGRRWLFDEADIKAYIDRKKEERIGTQADLNKVRSAARR